MPIVRTPDERFGKLPNFPYEPRYVEVNGLRLHYIEQGQGQVVLCLHGEPTWSFLYRKMIPPLSSRHRVLAMDFVGFGRSDKYAEPEAYSFHMHRDTLVGFIESLDLRQITLVVHDWGGLIGLTVATQLPERFARLVILNTFLPTGEGPPSGAFLVWRRFAEWTPFMPIGCVIRIGSAHGCRLPRQIVQAYQAPFPSKRHKAGAAVWPLLAPLRPDDPGAAEIRAVRQDLSTWTKPALVMFSDGDPVTGGGEAFFRALIPAAREQPAITIRDAGHFLQEDKGKEIAQHILAFMARTPL